MISSRPQRVPAPNALDWTPSQCPVGARLQQRLGQECPPAFRYYGNIQLLSHPKTALLCSSRYPASIILPTFDQASRWRDEGRCIVSGFHSPMEQECLRILLRGKSPVILCPARTLPVRIPSEWEQPLQQGRLLVFSGFQAHENRMTAALAVRRNALVAALADELFFPHIRPGGQIDQLSSFASSWNIPHTIL